MQGAQAFREIQRTALQGDSHLRPGEERPTTAILHSRSGGLSIAKGGATRSMSLHKNQSGRQRPDAYAPRQPGRYVCSPVGFRVGLTNSRLKHLPQQLMLKSEKYFMKLASHRFLTDARHSTHAMTCVQRVLAATWRRIWVPIYTESPKGHCAFGRLAGFHGRSWSSTKLRCRKLTIIVAGRKRLLVNPPGIPDNLARPELRLSPAAPIMCSSFHL
jgi:hypothetical protein